MTVGSEDSLIRFTATMRCPICDGHQNLPRKQGVRCEGFTSPDGQYVHCGREEHAGELTAHPETGLYVHWMGGPCNCGKTHVGLNWHRANGTPGLKVHYPRDLPKSGDQWQGKRFFRSWSYVDQDGSERIRVARFNGIEPKDKTFLAYSKQHGQWWPTLAQVSPNGEEIGGTVERMLYRLPEILHATVVLLCEGEKAADAGRELEPLLPPGWVFTCTLGGSKAGKNSESAARAALKDKIVAILPDNDDDGKRYAEQAKAALVQVARSVRLVHLPGLGDAEDIADWIPMQSDTEAAAVGLEDLFNSAPIESPERSTSNETAASPSIPRKQRAHAARELSDLGNGERIIDAYGDRLAFNDAMGWIAFDGRRWEIQSDHQARAWAQDTLRRIPDEAKRATGERPEAILKHAARSTRTSAISNALTEARPHLIRKADEFDADPMDFNCLNGTLDLRTGKLRKHDAGNFITKIAPIMFNSEASCPTWERGLLEIFSGNDDLIDYVQRLLGYALTGLTSEHVVGILHGAGMNGKSTLVETSLAIVGDYGQKTSAEMFMIAKRNSGQATPEIARLAGTRLLAAVESGEGRRLNEPLVKELSGGDTVLARHLYKGCFEFKPQFKTLFATNHKPVIRGSDYAIWRRIHLIPFNVKFRKPDEPITDANVDWPIADQALREKLMAEAPGILNWMLRGCLEWQDGGLRPPNIVIAATQEYRADNDPLLRFFAECLDVDPTRQEWETTSKKIWEEWQEWETSNGKFEAVTQIKIGKRLEEEGCLSKVKRVQTKKETFWFGVKIRSDEPEGWA